MNLLMSLLKKIFNNKTKLKCAVCGEIIGNNFGNATPSVKTKYLKLNGCYGLYMLHYSCYKKIKELKNVK